MRYLCAWKGCTAVYVSRLPPGWICFVTFRGTLTPGILDFTLDRVDRDAVLCPDHAAELDQLLFPLK